MQKMTWTRREWLIGASAVTLAGVTGSQPPLGKTELLILSKVGLVLMRIPVPQVAVIGGLLALSAEGMMVCDYLYNLKQGSEAEGATNASAQLADKDKRESQTGNTVHFNSGNTSVDITDKIILADDRPLLASKGSRYQLKYNCANLVENAPLGANNTWTADEISILHARAKLLNLWVGEPKPWGRRPDGKDGFKIDYGGRVADGTAINPQSRWFLNQQWAVGWQNLLRTAAGFDVSLSIV